MKRTKKEYSRSISGIRTTSESTKSNSSVKSTKKSYTSSSGTYFDARSDGADSDISNKWCLKSVEDDYENENIFYMSKVTFFGI